MFEHVRLSRATNVVDWNGVYYDKEVLRLVDIGYEVRVHVYVSDDSDLEGWDYESDSPYLVICDRIGSDFLGEVQRRYRYEDDFRYPIRAGERIWFRAENIIEIPRKFQPQEEAEKLKPFLQREFVPITGPLYLVAYNDSDSESDSGSCSNSDSDCDSSGCDVEVRRRGRSPALTASKT